MTSYNNHPNNQNGYPPHGHPSYNQNRDGTSQNNYPSPNNNTQYFGRRAKDWTIDQGNFGAVAGHWYPNGVPDARDEPRPPPPASGSVSYFEEAQNFRIKGGHFMSVGGNMYGSPPQAPPNRERPNMYHTQSQPQFGTGYYPSNPGGPPSHHDNGFRQDRTQSDLQLRTGYRPSNPPGPTQGPSHHPGPTNNPSREDNHRNPNVNGGSHPSSSRHAHGHHNGTTPVPRSGTPSEFPDQPTQDLR